MRSGSALEHGEHGWRLRGKTTGLNSKPISLFHYCYSVVLLNSTTANNQHRRQWWRAGAKRLDLHLHHPRSPPGSRQELAAPLASGHLPVAADKVRASWRGHWARTPAAASESCGQRTAPCFRTADLRCFEAWAETAAAAHGAIDIYLRALRIMMLSRERLTLLEGAEMHLRSMALSGRFDLSLNNYIALAYISHGIMPDLNACRKTNIRLPLSSRR